MWCRHVIVCATLALVVAGIARGAQPSISAVESSVRLGLVGGFAQYEQRTQPQGTATGAVLGFDAGVSVLTPSGFGRFGWPDFYGSVTYEFSSGLLGYRETIGDESQKPIDFQERDLNNTVIVRLGLGRPIVGTAEVIPFAAAGYQNWTQNFRGDAGYGEFYQSGLMGGGLRLDLAASPWLVLSAVAEGFAVLGGPATAPSQDFSAGLGANAEERVSLDANYQLSDAWHAFAGVGLTHYGYAGSKPGVTGEYQPESTTLQVNSVFGFAYGF